jgi:tungstate transport system substrate-binding protein
MRKPQLLISKLLTILLMGLGIQTFFAQSNPPKVEATYGQGAKNFKLATGSPSELDLPQRPPGRTYLEVKVLYTPGKGKC